MSLRPRPRCRPRACSSVEKAPKLLQEAHAVGDLARVRGIDEREARDVTEAERGHLEDDRGQRGALDLGLGELRPRLVVLLGVEADAHARRHPPAPAGALGCTRPADRLDGQPLDLGALAVAGDPGGARVDDVADAGDGERGLGHVGREDDPPPAPPVEHAVLLGGGEPGEEREHLGVRQPQGTEGLRGVADLPLAGEEREDVGGLGAGWRLGPQFLDGLDDPRHLVTLGHDVTTVGVELDEGPVADLHREGAAGHLDDGDLADDVSALVGREVPGEPVGVDRRRGDEDLEVGAAGQELLEVAEDEVDVERPLVGLVDDDRVVAAQVAVALHLVEQDAVGHHLDARRVAAAVGEPHLVADEVPELDLHLLGDPLGHRARGDPAGLRVADLSARAEAQLEAHLRQLGRLARPRLTGEDDDLVVTDGGEDVVAALDDGQVLGVPQPGTVDRVDGLGTHAAKDRLARRTPQRPMSSAAGLAPVRRAAAALPTSRLVPPA